MNKREKIISIIDDIIEIMNNLSILSQNETDFVEKYKDHLLIFQSRIINNEIDVSGRQPNTGLFKWLSDYDGIIDRNPNLYNKVYKLEKTFTKP